MSLQQKLTEQIKAITLEHFGASPETVEFQATRKEFEGDITVVVFPMLKVIKGNPVVIGETIGNHLKDHSREVVDFNVVKGFLNLVLSDEYFLEFFKGVDDFSSFGTQAAGTDAMMVEYASPNTNKPLHLGHMRNILLGYAVAEILKAAGKKVYKTQIINDRGIHICKSMLAWKLYGRYETPNRYNMKPDHFVGKYYVKYDLEFKKQLREVILNLNIDYYNIYKLSFNSEKDIEKSIESSFEGIDTKLYLDSLKKSIVEYINYRNPTLGLNQNKVGYDILFNWNVDLKDRYAKEIERLRLEFLYNYYWYIQKTGQLFFKIPNDIFDEYCSIKTQKRVISFIEKNFEDLVPILDQAKEMLVKWEEGDEEIVELWNKMNNWVYQGFNETYDKLGVDFDETYYESDTYLLGKDNIAEGLEKGVFFKKEDGSVWCDLTEEGLDEKIVLRSDGTAVYMTQDIGTAIQRVKDHPDVNGMIYTVGNEQDYHFKVLFLILKKLGYTWAENLYHLSYGMVDLPSGKMKSREGTVVDADDLIAEMSNTAREISEELGKIDDFSEEEKTKLYHTIGMGALKYYILKVDPRKGILFDPKESVDFQGNTGPFIQYTYARIQSILRKASGLNEGDISEITLHPKEKELLKQLQLFPEIVQGAAANYSPALIANYIYDLVKEFNSFYQNVTILGAEIPGEKSFRVQLSDAVAKVIKTGFALLGIDVPERM